MSSILVTGAGGQLGSELKFLSSSYPHSFHFASKDELNIGDENAVNQFFAKHSFDFVINTAAYTAVDKAETEKETAMKMNADAVGSLARVCRAKNIRLVHFSTDFVFDGSLARPLSEEEVTNPLNVYGASKLKGEQLALQHCPEVLIVRTSWVYSSFGNNFVKTILRLCRERDSLNIIYDQIGTPTYARDLAQAVLQIIEQKDWKAGVFNYSNEGVASWYDFAMAIRDLAELKTKIQPIETAQYPTPAVRPKYSVLNKSKIRNTFGLSIPYWRHSLETCVSQLR